MDEFIKSIPGFITIGLIWFYFAKRKKQQAIQEKIDDNNRAVINQQKQEESKIKVNQKLEKLKTLKTQVEEACAIKVNTVEDLKAFILENEKTIIEKGGDDKLFQFLKLDTFLQDYRSRIIEDINSNSDIDFQMIERRIIEDEKKDGLEKTIEQLNDSINSLEGRAKTSLTSKIDNLFQLGKYLKPSISKEIETLNFYNSMAVGLVVFYLDDKKIRFFEIFESFEKLGVFDSSWQKNVAAKLTSIDIRLAQLNNQMTDLNDNFTRLLVSSENIAQELKQGLDSMNSKMDTNNLLTAITTYQVYKINKGVNS